MTTNSVQPRRARGIHPKRRETQQLVREKGSSLLEYLESTEIQALIAAAPNPQARLLILIQWRAGLRVSEALALTAAGCRDSNWATSVATPPLHS